MKLNLPDVTLVMLETREHELARMAIEDCLDKATFGNVLVMTDRPLEFASLTALCKPTIKTIPDAPSKLGWCQQLWYDIPPHVTTSHALFIQWDSWIWDETKWRDEFLNYDYIGAPWWYQDGRNVGNSGFGIKSTRLIRFLRKHPFEFPCDREIEDDLLCRTYRPALQALGFTWAPEWIAHDFAWEGCNQPPTKTTHFGFHAMFNWPKVLDQERLAERLQIAMESDYISKSYMMKAFCEMHPQIIKGLLEAGGHLEQLNPTGVQHV